MTGGEIILWLQLALGAAFVVAMLWLARWALFGDRPRGRLRCPKCWYDLTYSYTLTCSECGHMADGAGQLTRTRRRWFTAALAIVAVTTLGLVVLVQAGDRGWATMAPTRVLIWAMPWVDNVTNPVHRELRRRASAKAISDQQALRVLERCVSGDWRARPPSQAWVDKYGRLLQVWWPIVAGQPGARELLLSLPARVELATPPLWPADCPATMQVRLESWWPEDTGCRLTLTPRSPAGEALTLHCDMSRRFRMAVAVPLPALSVSTTQAVIDVRIDQRPAPPDGVAALQGWRTVSTTTFTLPVRVLPPDAPMPLAAVSNDAAMDAIMSAVFRGTVVKWSEGRSPVRVRYDPRQTNTSMFDDTAIGVVIEITRDDGAIARRLRLWWLGGNAIDDTDRALGWELPYEDADLLPQVNSDDGRWSMRVRGELATACRVGAGTRFWAGDLTMPLLVRDTGSPAPPPLWWTEP